LRLFSFGGYGLALAALALVVFGAIECPQPLLSFLENINRTNAYKNKVSVLKEQRLVL